MATKLIEQPSGTPTRKVQAAGIAAAVVVLLPLVASVVGVDLPKEAAEDLVEKGLAVYTAVAVFIPVAVAYFTKNRATDKGQ